MSNDLQYFFFNVLVINYDYFMKNILDGLLKCFIVLNFVRLFIVYHLYKMMFCFNYLYIFFVILVMYMETCFILWNMLYYVLKHECKTFCYNIIVFLVIVVRSQQLVRYVRKMVRNSRRVRFEDINMFNLDFFFTNEFRFMENQDESYCNKNQDVLSF